MLNDPLVDAPVGGLDKGRAKPPEVEQGDSAHGRLPALTSLPNLSSLPVLLRLGVCALPWLLALGVAIVTLVQMGTPLVDIVRYGAYWAFGVILPGLLVARATVGTRGNWPEDVALGAVTGLALELAWFMFMSLLGQQHQLWLGSLIVALIFLAVPRLRRHWRLGSPLPLPLSWSWGVAAAIAVSTVIVRGSAFPNPMPPAGGVYDQDVTWHLSIVHELTRSFLPQIPQVAGEILRYHFFSHAHLAAAHLISGVPEATVVLRLSILPLLAATALIGARLAVELSGRWWSGPVAAWGLIVFEGTDLLPVLGDAGVIFPSSPSQTFLLPVILGCCTLIVRALRGLSLRAGWAVLLLMLVAAAGAKPTAMPLILAGACLAGLSLLIQHRQWLAAGWVVAMVGVILPISVVFVAGSDGRASRLSLFDFIEWTPLYRELTGAQFHPSTGPFVPEGLSDLSSRSLVILGLFLLVPLVANIARLAPFALLASGPLRKDPAAWFMCGVVVAGWGVYLVLAHPAYSQAYFLRLTNPVATVFGAWALASVVPPAARGRRLTAAALVGGTALGVAAVAAGRALTPEPAGMNGLSGRQAGGTGSVAEALAMFAAPLSVACVAVGAGVIGWRLLNSRLPLRGWGAAVVLSALVVGGPAHGAMAISGRAIADFATNRPVVKLIADRPVPKGGGYRISAGAAAALAWVNQNVPDDAVVATNRHCVAGAQRAGCFSLSFWLSGLGGRRTVLEGWGYTSSARFADAPSPFPQRLAVNDAVFTRPSPRTIGRLRQDYGATWLVADRSAGPVSAELKVFAAARFSSGEVTVYEIR